MKFILGSEKDFYGFVDSIKEEDKIGVITHTDLDGIASGIFLEKILNQKNTTAECIRFIPYEKGMFGKLINEFKKKKITKVFLTDINADVSDLEGFEELRRNFECFLIDHHPINSELKNLKNILKSPSYDCSTFVLYNLAKNYVDVNDLDWLVCATMMAEWSFNDEDNLAFIDLKYPGTSKNIALSEPKKISDIISSALVYFDNIPKVFELVKAKKLKEFEKAYEIIEKELQNYIRKFNLEAKYFSSKRLFFAYFRMKHYMASHLATVISKQDLYKTYVFATDFKDKRGYLKISARNQSGREDVSELMKKACLGLEEYTAGGHKKAAAASIRKQDMKQFKENLLA